MDLELIFYLLILLVIIVVIFKVIKKLIFAIFAVIALIIVVIVGLGALVYADYNYLTKNENFTVELVYQKDSEYVLGVEIPIIESELQVEDVSSLSIENLDKDVKSRDNKFLVIVDDVLFQKLMSQSNISLNDIIQDENLNDVSLDITGEQVSNILETQEFQQELTQIVMEENDIPLIYEETTQEALDDVLAQVDENSQITPQEAIFLLAMSNAIEQESNILTLIEGFKNETLQIYPDRFVFKLVRSLPVETIQGFLPEDMTS